LHLRECYRHIFR